MFLKRYYLLVIFLITTNKMHALLEVMPHDITPPVENKDAANQTNNLKLSPEFQKAVGDHCNNLITLIKIKYSSLNYFLTAWVIGVPILFDLSKKICKKYAEKNKEKTMGILKKISYFVTVGFFSLLTVGCAVQGINSLETFLVAKDMQEIFTFSLVNMVKK